MPVNPLGLYWGHRMRDDETERIARWKDVFAQ
jgi:hypothetical protein